MLLTLCQGLLPQGAREVALYNLFAWACCTELLGDSAGTTVP